MGTNINISTISFEFTEFSAALLYCRVLVLRLTGLVLVV